MSFPVTRFHRMSRLQQRRSWHSRCKNLLDKALAGPLPKLTAKTKTQRKDIDKDYRTVRKNGYATCWDEMAIGLGAIAVPIHLPDIGVVFSLGIAGFIDRLTRRPVPETVELLHAALEPMVRVLRNREDAPEIRSRNNVLFTMRAADSSAGDVQ